MIHHPCCPRLLLPAAAAAAAGTVNGNGVLLVRASRVGRDTTLSQVGAVGMLLAKLP